MTDRFSAGEEFPSDGEMMSRVDAAGTRFEAAPLPNCRHRGLCRRRDRRLRSALHVEEGYIRGFGHDRGERLCHICSFAGNNVACVLEQFPRDGAKRLLIVDDQHAFAHGCNRRTTLP
jgi:hypothetical protein